MSPETFNHHVMSSRNDFSNWINDMFNQKELADNLRKATNQTELILILKDAREG
jgi:mannitol/fructose-specific phosphotransferase system IIA component (Ntr-type)